MGTRSMIGISDGSEVKAIYCHWDGYLSHNGRILLEHYQDKDKVEKLIALGDISSLGNEIGEKVDFDIQFEDEDKQCIAYHRDRGDALHIKTFSKSDFLRQDYEFVYLYENGTWYVSNTFTNENTLRWVLLKDAVNGNIEIQEIEPIPFF